MTTACIGIVWASSLEAGDGVPFAVDRADHVSSASADPGVPAAVDSGATAVENEAPPGVTMGTSALLVINPTFDSSITGDPNSAAIQAMINDAIAIYEAHLNDPITVSILFRYATTAPGGSPLPGTTLAQSNYVIYFIPWNTYIASLTADATTANDATANASLPGSPLTTNVLPSSADGRAVGLATPPAMFANGTVGVGGPYDGIVTLNSSQPLKFTRPPAVGMYDALRSTEHEIDEVLGLGSSIGVFGDLRPQDLFSWSSAGVRSLTTSGSRYFSIDSGTTNLIRRPRRGLRRLAERLPPASDPGRAECVQLLRLRSGVRSRRPKASTSTSSGTIWSHRAARRPRPSQRPRRSPPPRSRHSAGRSRLRDAISAHH
jgi:hypothetical protein